MLGCRLHTSGMCNRRRDEKRLKHKEYGQANGTVKMAKKATTVAVIAITDGRGQCSRDMRQLHCLQSMDPVGILLGGTHIHRILSAGHTFLSQYC